MATVKFDYSQLTTKLKAAAGLKTFVMKEAFKTFTKYTPIRTGNAKSHTRLVNNTIEANYSYASVLDQGRSIRDGQMRGSIQAPQGMTIPTTKEMYKLIKQFAAKGLK